MGRFQEHIETTRAPVRPAQVVSPYVEHLHMIPESGLLACPCGARKHAPEVIFEIGERESRAQRSSAAELAHRAWSRTPLPVEV